MKGERGEKVEEEKKEGDWIVTVGQEVEEVGLLVPGMGSEGVEVQVELEEVECHRVIPHLPPHLLQAAGSEHVHGHSCAHVNEPEQELQDRVWILLDKHAHHS